MKKAWKTITALVLILVAVMLILDALNVLSPLASIFGEVSVFTIALGVLLIVWTVERIVKGKIHDIFLPLALIFMLFEKNIAKLCGFKNDNIIHNGVLVLVALLLSAGFGILFGNTKKKKIRKKLHTHASTHVEYSDDGVECSLGSSTVYIDGETLSPHFIENNLCSCSVYFENPDKYAGGGVINVENNLGSMTVHVPSSWFVIVKAENNLGVTSSPERDHVDGPTLTIYVENNLGSVNIKYV